MKILKSITSLLILLSILNVIVGKSMHEIFEHKHELHECEYEGIVHMHEYETVHPDLLCDFNFSASLIQSLFGGIDGLLHYHETKTSIQFLWLAKNLFHDSKSSRGPPTC